jgi:hypothetical protein
MALRMLVVQHQGMQEGWFLLRVLKMQMQY